MKTSVTRICYFGDSVTNGRGHDNQTVPAEKRWTALVDKELESEYLPNRFFYTLNLGVNGDTTRQGLERLPQALNFCPQIVTLQFGMNDCNCWLSDGGLFRVNPRSFKYNLMELIEKFRVGGVKKIILASNYLIPVPKPMLNGKDYNENNSYYNTLIREAAAETETTLCDMEELFKNDYRENNNFLEENGKWIHLSEAGNRIYAEKILSYIKEAVNGL